MKGAFLTRWEAALHLDRLLLLEGIETDIDLYQLLTENGRNPAALSAIKRGHLRGNRARIGKIPTIRIKGRVCYPKSKLEDWFDRFFLPSLKMAA